MKIKTPSLSNILFLAFIVLLIIPQTRKSIQIAVNKLKVLVWSPSELDAEDQSKLAPFSYQLKALDGSANSIEIGQGKVTFISYWATWCPPCIAELPSIQKLYQDYGEQINFMLLTNEDPEIVTSFLKKRGFDLPIYFPKMEAPEVLNAENIPTNYIIDKTGKIIIKETGSADWNSKKVRGVLEGLLEG